MFQHFKILLKQYLDLLLAHIFMLNIDKGDLVITVDAIYEIIQI